MFRFYIEILLHQRGFHNFCHDSNLLNAFTIYPHKGTIFFLSVYFLIIR